MIEAQEKKVEYDRARGLILVREKGFKTVGDVRATRAQLDAALMLCRRDFQHAKVLVVAGDAVVQSAEVMREATDQRWTMTHPDDRMALLVTSSLVKMQANRHFVSDQEKAFVSESAALTWLMASREANRASPAGADH